MVTVKSAFYRVRETAGFEICLNFSSDLMEHGAPISYVAFNKWTYIRKSNEKTRLTGFWFFGLVGRRVSDNV